MRVKMNGQYSQSCSTLPRANGKRGAKNGGHNNSTTTTTTQGDLKRNSMAGGASYHRLERHPSQANMWSTTVPQSLVNQKLGSRHAPTRNSLRHSRMLVLSKSSGGVVPRKYLPPVLEQMALGTSLVVIQFLIGLVLTGLAGYILIWSPTLLIQDIPHYSGLSFLLSGWIGIMLVICCRHHYPGTRHVGCVFQVKSHYIIINVIISVLSILFGFLAFIFHFLHLYFLLRRPPCTEFPLPLAAPEWLDKVIDLAQDRRPMTCRCNEAFFGSKLEYSGLTCEEVHAILPSILGCSGILNLGACLAALWFVILLVQSKGKPPSALSSSSSNNYGGSKRRRISNIDARNSIAIDRRRRSVV